MSGLRARVGALLPRRADYAGARASWRRDALAGITVAVVALPLALGFGVSSGMTPEAGIITAVVAGVVAAVFGGSHLQVSGPTGAMAVVLLPIVAQHGAAAVATVGIMAGLLIVAAALAGAGRHLALIPWPVVEGFTVGIAAVIALQQVPAALGVARPDGDNGLLVAAAALGRADPAAWAAPALVAVVAATMWAAPRVHRAIPGALAAVAAATIVAELAGLDAARIGALPAGLPAPALPALDPATVGDLGAAAVAVAVLAAVESLLSGRVAHGMSAGGPPFDPDRELLGQGLANLAAPAFGGMPATGAIARSAVNARAGARTRLAAAVHALALGALVLAGAGLVARIPMAALAGVLMVTAWRMVERRAVRAVVGAGRADALVFALTAGVTAAFDLILAIALCVAVAGALALRAVARASRAERTPVARAVGGPEAADRGIVALRLEGALFFGGAPRLLDALPGLGDARVVILRMRDLRVLDATGAQALARLVSALEDRGTSVLLKGPRPEHLRALRAVGLLEAPGRARPVFGDLPAAVAHARDLLAAPAAGRPALTGGAPAT